MKKKNLDFVFVDMILYFLLSVHSSKQVGFFIYLDLLSA